MTVLIFDGLQVATDLLGTSEDLGTLRGLLVEDHHDGVPRGVAAARGIVRRLRVVTRALSLREVQHAPAAFADRDRGLLADLELLRAPAAPA